MHIVWGFVQFFNHFAIRDKNKQKFIGGFPTTSNIWSDSLLQIKQADLANAALSIPGVMPRKYQHSLINSADKFSSGAHKAGQGTRQSFTCWDKETSVIQKVKQ